MADLDLKNRKILYHLDADARQSYARIGKKVGLSKNGVAHRVNRLIDDNVIQNFYTVFNPYLLGFSGMAILFKYQYANERVRNDIIDMFVDFKNTWYVSTAEGTYDLVASVWVKDIGTFLQFYNQVMEKFGQYIKTQFFRNYFQQHHYRHSYLVGESYRQDDRDEIARVCPGRLVDIDQTDFDILKSIACDARLPLTTIAKESSVSSSTVRCRLKQLRSAGVIKVFRTGINVASFGCQLVNIDIHLSNNRKRGIIMDYIKINPHLIDMFTSVGKVDVQCVFCVKNLEQVHTIMHQASNKFPGLVRDYEYIIKTRLYKWNWMPGELTEVFQ